MKLSFAAGERFLGLHDFEVVGDARGEAVARLLFLLAGQIRPCCG